MTEDASPDPLLGRTVADGRYQVQALLGVGGMGTVYRALQHPLERQVALKLIHRELAKNETIVARFEREMRMTASIEHPHTVRVYDFGRIDGQPFLAMEYLAGRSLRAVLDTGGALPIERLAAIGLQIAKALRAAHQAGIVHRDLKPDNVLLVDGYGERDFVKVLDFGIARPLEQEPGFQTVAGAIVGTPAYMSPEQVTGAAIDARSDLYALGVMLFEMATGAPPFAGSTTALLVAQAQQAPPSLDGFDAIPAGVRMLIAQLLQKDPAARPASAEAVLDALAPFSTAETGTRTTGAAAPRTAILSSSLPAPAPHAGGTLVLPGETKAADQARAAVPAGRNGGRSAPGGHGKWMMLLGGLLVIGGAGALGYHQRLKSQGQDARRVQTPTGKEGAPGPANGVAEPLDADSAGRVWALLQAPGEPPWPVACHSRDAAVLRRLSELGPALAATATNGPDAAARVDALTALGALPDASAERWVLEARATLAANPAAAAHAAAEAVARCPSSAVAHNLLGNALQRTQQLDRAAEEYAAASGLTPAFLAPRFNLGLTRLRRDDAAGALAAFQAVSRADPDYPNLPLVRADAHRRLGDVVAARADLQDQVARHPAVAEGWLQLGRARAAAHDGRGAREAYCHAKALGDAVAAGLCRK